MAAGDFDVAIIGAGPAGCTAALRLPAGMRALLVDRTVPPGGRCCGGLLAPDGQAALAALGLALPDSVCVQPQPRRVHVRDLDTGREQTYRRNYINLDRDRFDAWLLGLAAERAEFRPDTRFVGSAAADGTAAGTLIRLSSAGREETVRVRFVMGADGADSLVRLRCLGPDLRPAVMLAIQVRLAAAPPACHEVLFSRLLTDFYAWAIPKPESVLVGAAFSDIPRARELFDALLPRILRELGLEGKVVERSARRLARPRSRSELLAGRGRVLLAGEAAGLVSPSSGEGLSFALASGAAAGAAAGAADPLAAYGPTFRRLSGRVARKLIKARIIFSPRLRPLAMRLPWCP